VPFTHDNVFNKVSVDYMVAGGARVTWEINRYFTDPEPHYFTLQVNRNFGETDDWETIGSENVLNVNWLMDGTHRLYAKDLNLVYRVRLVTQNATYYSLQSQVMGNLTVRQWNLARVIARKLDLQSRRRTLVTFPGYLLKHKLYGTECSCLDPFTKESTNTDHELCYGTGVLGGYWKATEHSMYQKANDGDYPHLDPAGNRGTIDDQVISAQFRGLPGMARHDVWVDASSDLRYSVHKVDVNAAMNSVPLIATVELRLVPLGHILYSVPLGT
jgi:hypothetical protein